MFEGLTFSITDLGAGGVVVLIVLLILTDRLVTKARLLEERAEKKLWQSNAEIQQEINRENTKTLANYAQAALVQKKVMKALQLRHGLTDAELDVTEDGSP